MLTRVTTLMNHYTGALAQSGTFGSRSWVKALRKEHLIRRETFSSLRMFCNNEEVACDYTTKFPSDSEDGSNLTNELKVEANPVILKIRICRRSEEPLNQIEVRWHRDQSELGKE